jgi:tRNA U34 5-methylaminomethyl-2-thiouridine-forming methyltransferase MnmC
LEIGFGTGLNCYLTLLECLNKDRHIHYYAAEKFPVPEEIWKNLKYSENCADNNSGLFEQLHQVPWNCDVEINNQFTICKMECDILQSNYIDLPSIDLVYFDAFSPEKQAELWDRSVFEDIFSRMNNDGILVTYCAKGIVRRLLQSVGFTVERIPGPPGKREMLRAKKLKC